MLEHVFNFPSFLKLIIKHRVENQSVLLLIVFSWGLGFRNGGTYF